MTVRVVTNNVPRPLLDAWELTAAERERFDYIDWVAIEEGRDSASFFRYRGELYDLGEFTADFGIMKGSGLPAYLSEWHGYLSDSAFSAVVVRLCEGWESVVVGMVLS